MSSQNEQRDRAWLAEAVELARAAAQADEVPVGALIVRDEVKLASRGNQKETSNDPCGHAEILALRDAAAALGSWRLENCVLYVTLEPCPMCLGALQQARISRVVYGAHDPKGGALSLGYRLHEDSRTNHRFRVDYLETPESSAVLREFFRKKRNPSS